MAINISKSGEVAGSNGGDPVARFRQLIANRVSADYCDIAEREALLREAVAMGLDRPTADATLDLELESSFIANEHRLLANFESMLRRFTDQDKKLDPKEHADAIQIACKPSGGCRQGLKYDVAERFLISFCRSNGVKMKTGFMRWAVP